ncbi:PcF and SCR74-like cys-rich secreted peptide, putative [Phytophthora infestans T30-4]|uniref:PcF and SCR74-like cys-rich secreted peptide, putative n=1 Tax=Phytophthora infestans (strain T30-4) TaxID=403677 RepID=D0NU29_PHYIT|nr:PcF and SCR74-like cys-rich secreted peptide, putative [Phytophthora infestans T30-4]EEY65153.1 PcF and SCR74-like cys-rich secreted peptide, putative [Phytophthora infestans T30-4]|eukprot:XP_002897410.1 PcF and SCR74-like cys-rich secreted peptide, putative [Phytophthora infestans T30-4]
MKLMACIVALIGAVTTIAVTPANATSCPRTLGCGNEYSESNIEVGNCCEKRGGDFAACCAASCSTGSPCG